VKLDPLGITLGFSRGNCLAQKLGVVDAPIQILAVQDVDFDLCHIESTGMFGRTVTFQTIQ
jgi:hypothetical protein